MERLKARIEAFKREQIRLSSQGFPRKYQQEHFLHSVFSSDTSDAIYQETGQFLLATRGTALFLFLENECHTPDSQLRYTIPLLDIGLPFYMYYLDERYLNPKRESISENVALMTLELKQLPGIKVNPFTVRVSLDKNFSRGEITLSEEKTHVHLPYNTYRSVPESKIRHDAKKLYKIMEGLKGHVPDCIKYGG